MASSPNDQSNQVRASSVRHGCSSSQASLAKILRTISTFQPCGVIKDRDSRAKLGEGFCWGNRGFGFDLNLKVGHLDAENEGSDDLLCIAADGDVSASSAIGGGGVGGEAVLAVVVVEKSSEGECESRSEKEQRELYGHDESDEEEDTEAKRIEAVDEERTTEEVSEITNPQFQGGSERTKRGEDRKTRTQEEEKEGEKEDPEIEIVLEEEEEDGNERKTRSFWGDIKNEEEGYIGLLIEAAKLISGDFGEEEPPVEEVGKEAMKKRPSRNGGGVVVSRELRRGTPEITTCGMTRIGSTKRARDQHCWTVDLFGGDDLEAEEMSPPVVRSKRGRSQVLPCRFRDSVLEPWKPLSRTRPIPNPVPRRRRSRR